MYSSTAKSQCTLCDIEITATVENMNAIEAELEAINDLHQKLNDHFHSSEHCKKTKLAMELTQAEFKEYNINIVGYINGL